MEEDCDVKPCDIKLKSELILDDDYNYDYYPGPCQEANSQVPNTDFLKLHPVVVLERLDLSLLNGASYKINPSSINDGVPKLKMEMKVENTEDEDPLAGAVPSDEWPILNETASTPFYEGKSTVFQKDIRIKWENDSSEETNHRNELPIYDSLKSGDKNGTQGKSSHNCDTRNTCSRIKTCEIKDTLSDIIQDSCNQTLPNASNISFHLDKQSPGDSGKQPFEAKHCRAAFTDRDKHKAEAHSGEEHSGEEYFCCKYCSAQFDEVKSFYAHVKTHSIEKIFSCGYCSVQYALKDDLVAHVRSHFDGKPFSCVFCPLRFSEQESLEVHLCIHSSEKFFSCKYCPAQFKNQYSLTAHLQTHSGKKPFCCKHCPARYRWESHLTVHLRIHFDEKPFSCELCPAKFNQKGHLTVHLRIHFDKKPFSCKLCPARFYQKRHLTEHLRIHSDKKRFSCKLCPARFNQKSHLAKHLRCHSGKKLYSCEKCSAVFKLKKYLKAHNILTHSKKYISSVDSL